MDSERPNVVLVQSVLDVQTFKKNWGWFLAAGILLVILGIFAASASVFTTMISIVLLGTLLVIGGVAKIIYSIWLRRWTGFVPNLLVGILYTIVGVYTLMHPAASAVALTLLIAVLFLISGTFRVASSLTLQFENWGWVLFSGLISIALGGMILAEWPESGLWVLGLFIGIDLIFAGWTWIFLSLQARNLQVK
jgi:uncharacterized membrane protein HdeD (DUF308 family)